MSLLIVDDDELFASELSESLSRRGVRNQFVTSARAALQLLRTSAVFETFLVDISMPEIDGIELVRKIRLLNLPTPANVVVLTGAASLERAVAAVRVGVNEFLRKPADISEIENAIRSSARVEINVSDQRYEVLRRIMNLTDRLNRQVPVPLFGDPSLRILIDLAIADSSGSAVPTMNLCVASGVATTTALRRIDELADCGLVVRDPDPVDRRRMLVRLSERGKAIVDKALADQFSLARNGADVSRRTTGDVTALRTDGD